MMPYTINSVVPAHLLLALLVAFGSCPGCSEPKPQRVPVIGKVLVDGQPLTVGTIRFVPATGRPVSGRIGTDGSFRIVSKPVGNTEVESVGLLPGSYRIEVTAREIIDEATDRVRDLAPRQYADFRTSGLQMDIGKSMEPITVELTWPETTETDAGGSADHEQTQSVEEGATGAPSDPARNPDPIVDE